MRVRVIVRLFLLLRDVINKVGKHLYFSTVFWG